VDPVGIGVNRTGQALARYGAGLARSENQAAGTGYGFGLPIGIGLPLGQNVAAPIAKALANYLRSPSGQDLKSAINNVVTAPSQWVNTLLGGHNPLPFGGGGGPTLQQYNPPGYNPSKPVMGADLVRSAQAVGPDRSVSSRPNAGAGPNGPNPNAIVQGQDGIGEEYRQRLAAYNNQAILARQALQGYDPSKGPLPGAAQEARDQGLDIWKGFYAGTKMGQEGGAIGTFNPLMQAHGDVPSMEELWKGVGGGAPTTGPSPDAIKAAMARGINQPGSGGFYAPPGSPNPTAGFDQSANPAAASLQQQIDTAKQAHSGTEATTILQRTHDYLQDFKLGNLNPGNYSLPSTDYLKNFNWNADYSGIFK